MGRLRSLAATVGDLICLITIHTVCMHAETTPSWYANIKDAQDKFINLAPHLRHLRHLRNLSISRCSIADCGASALKPHLAHLPMLHTLTLSCNGIGDDGAVAIGSALQDCHELVKLNVRENLISSVGAKSLVEGATWSVQCRDLDMHGNKIKGRFLFGRNHGLSAAIAKAKEKGQIRVQY